MRIVFVLLALLLVVPVQAQLAPLVPRDDGANDPSFVLFRARLVEAIARRDAETVLSLFAPEARLSFGGTDGGPTGVRQVWYENGRPRPAFWAELGSVVALGSIRDPQPPTSAYDDGEVLITAPYTFAGFPRDYDAFEHVAVLGENVRVRSAPSLESDVLTALTYTVVPSRGGGEWTPITLADGRQGFISSRFVRSPIDYRIGFLKRGGGWSIVFFLAGD